MRRRVQLALFCCLVSIAIHFYLSNHYYPLKFGFSTGNSACNLDSKFDCDAVSASAFSAFLGIPLSVWGMIANVALMLLIIVSALEWSERPERFRRWTVLFAGASFATSLVMAVISLTQMQTYCLFCIGLYLLSAIIFFALKGTLREPFWQHLKLDLPHMWRENKGVLSALAFVPIGATLSHQMFIQNYGAGKMNEIVKESVANWEVDTQQTFVAQPSLTMGPSPEAAVLTLVEFADLRCSHCRRANYTLHAFVKAHPDVRLEFYAFPLDSTCNEKVESGNGISCRLAEAVFCAEKENKGWDLQKTLFDMQDQINSLGGVTDLDPVLSQAASQQGLNWERLQTCMADSTVKDAIKTQAKQGSLANVRATPTIFANGKLANRGQMLPVLEALRQKALQKRSNL